MTSEYKQTLSEIDIILKYISEDNLGKVPIKLRKYISENKAEDYVPDIKQEIPINEQEIKRDTLALLAIIYREYLCDSERKKILQEQDFIENQKKEKEKREKYNPDNLFIKNPSIIEPISEVGNTGLIEQKEIKWYSRIYILISKILKRFSVKNINK